MQCNLPVYYEINIIRIVQKPEDPAREKGLPLGHSCFSATAKVN
jgi:hypothetical protein